MSYRETGEVYLTIWYNLRGFALLGSVRTANVLVFWQVDAQVQGAVVAEQQVFLNFIGPKYCVEAE